MISNEDHFKGAMSSTIFRSALYSEKASQNDETNNGEVQILLLSKAARKGGDVYGQGQGGSMQKGVVTVMIAGLGL